MFKTFFTFLCKTFGGNIGQSVMCHNSNMLIPGFEAYEMSEEYPHDVTHVKSGRVRKWTISHDGYYQASLYTDGRKLTMNRARLIAHCFVSNPDGKPTIDHINRIRTDDRVENLRWATREEQVENQVYMRRTNTSGVRGVCWHKNRSKWVANIAVNGTRIYLGRFNDINDAEAAYRAKRRELDRE